MIKANSSYPLYIYNSYRDLQIIFPSVNTLAKLINSNHATIVNYIVNEELYRGEGYFSSLPFNLDDTPWVSDWTSLESKNIIIEIKNNWLIKKAIFVYNYDKKFIYKFNGVTHAEKNLISAMI